MFPATGIPSAASQVPGALNMKATGSLPGQKLGLLRGAWKFSMSGLCGQTSCGVHAGHEEVAMTAYYQGKEGLPRYFGARPASSKNLDSIPSLRELLMTNLERARVMPTYIRRLSSSSVESV